MTHDAVREFHLDGAEVNDLTYVSTLVGGRGRWPEDAQYPLAEYQLPQPEPNQVNHAARCRMVSASVQYSYEIMVDGHTMRLLAFDGYEIQPLAVDSFMIDPGESVDFELVPHDDTALSGRYWLRAQTLGAGIGPDVDVQRWNASHEAKAILTYDGDNGTDPTSSQRQCLADNRCRIFNCPYAVYPATRNKTCVPYSDAHSAFNQSYLADEYGLDTDEDGSDFVEYFINFRDKFANSRTFIPPTALLLPGPDGNANYTTPCPDDCDTNSCSVHSD